MAYVDFAIVGIMIVSGVLALMRGFTREVFSIISWGGAAFITLWLFPPLRSTGRSLLSFIDTPWVADIITAGVVFILALVALSYLTAKATEKLRGAANPGPFDGTAGFIFGLARGFVLVCLLYLFYGVVMQPEGGKDPQWIAHSAFLPLIHKTNDEFVALMSRAAEKIPQNPTAEMAPRVDRRTASRDLDDRDNGYSDGSRRDMDRLLGANRGSLRP